MGLSHCGLNMTVSKQELQPHGTLEFPCAAYSAKLTDRVEDIIPWHWHEELEILYVKEGVLSVKLPSKTFTLHKGDCAILNARVLHDATAEPFCELESMVFSSKLIGEEASIYYKKYLAPLLTGQFFDGHLVLSEEGSFIKEEFLKAFNAMCEDAFGYEFVVRECLRCFQRTISVSPMQYLLKYRMMQAAKMIESDMEKPISEIAREVGFDSLSYFSKIFKRFYKCTPSQYTRR